MNDKLYKMENNKILIDKLKELKSWHQQADVGLKKVIPYLDEAIALLEKPSEKGCPFDEPIYNPSETNHYTKRDLEVMYCLGMMNRNGVTVDEISEQLAKNYEHFNLCLNSEFISPKFVEPIPLVNAVEFAEWLGENGFTYCKDEKGSWWQDEEGTEYWTEQLYQAFLKGEEGK